MIIKKIDLITIYLPLKKYLKTSFGEIKNRETLIIKFYSNDNLIGYGESSLLSLPISEAETLSAGIKLLKNKICPLIIGRNFKDVLDFKNKLLDKFPKYPVTKIGLEGAFYHLLSQKNKIYLGKLFGSSRREIQSGETISVSNNKQSILKEVQKFVNKGYRILKVKIMPGYDLETIKIIRAKYKKLKLGVDANAAYNLKQINIFKELSKFNLTMIEQPFVANDLKGHSELQKQISTPLCLDESIKSLKDIKRAWVLNSCRVINIKPARIGSYYESIKIHDFCFKHNIDLFVGGRLESGIGKAFNLALAGMRGFNRPLDLSSSLEYFTDDIITPYFDAKNGKVKIPNKIGIGFKINQEKISKYTINKLTIAL